MSNTCIRVLADPVQIKDCKESLSRLEEDLSLTTQIFNLAGNAARLVAARRGGSARHRLR